MSKNKDTETQEDGDIKLDKNPWYMGVFKLLFFVLAFFLVIFTVMANIGGNDDFYKDSIEDYFTSATGYEARIAKLNNVRFFPSIVFDFEGLELRQNPEDETPLAFLEVFDFSTGFWDVAFSSGKIKRLNIENFNALPGAFTGKSITLEKVTLEDKPLEDKSIFIAEGKIGQKPLKAQMDMDVYGSGKGKKYRFADERRASISIGNIEVKAYLKDRVFEDFEIIQAKQPVLKGRMALENHGSSKFGIDGEFNIVQHGSAISMDLSYGRASGGHVKGDINSSALHLEDILEGSALRKFIDSASDIAGSKSQSGFSFPVARMDIDTSLESVLIGKTNLGDLKIPLSIKENVLSANIDDQFAAAKVKGVVTLSAQNERPALNIDLAFKEFDYGALQMKFSDKAEISGKGSGYFKAASSAATTSNLIPNLKGELMFVGAEGELQSDVINIWGGGLVNALVPDIEAKKTVAVNCAIMNFDIEEGVATSKTLFMDTQRVTLNGKGTYNIASDNLDIFLKPKTKDISLGDVSSGVNLTGPLSKPSVKPDLIDFGAKLGGILLGTVNPAFWALSLADLGLGDNHPCKPYIQSDGAAEATEAEEKDVPQAEEADQKEPNIDLNE